MLDVIKLACSLKLMFMRYNAMDLVRSLKV